jgi:hypothetical protein
VLVSWAHPAELTVFASSPGERNWDRRSRALAASGLVSVTAGIWPVVGGVIRVIRAIEAVAVVTAAEMTSSKVIVVEARHMIAAEATDMISTKPSDATAAKAAYVAAAEATDMATTEAAAHVASAKAATAVSSTAAAGLRVRGNKAAGKHRARQNHHHSSSHDILHLGWADLPPQGRSDVGVHPQSRANVAMEWRWGCLFVGSTKFSFIWTEHGVRSRQTLACAGSVAIKRREWDGDRASSAKAAA